MNGAFVASHTSAAEALCSKSEAHVLYCKNTIGKKVLYNTKQQSPTFSHSNNKKGLD
jgi:hypothetical protein